MTSRGEPSGSLKTMEDATWPTSIPSALAASGALRAVSAKCVIATLNPASDRADCTLKTDGWFSLTF